MRALVCVTLSLAFLSAAVVLLTEGKSQDFKHAVACEGDDIELNLCPQRSVIKIDSAMFGRKRSIICPNRANYTTVCGMNDVRHRVKAICDERNRCTFRADTALLGDVEECHYVAKYLDIYYKCAPTNDVADECENTAVQYDQDNHNNVLRVDISRDDDARFSVKHNNSVACNQQEYFFFIICVLGVLYSFN